MKGILLVLVYLPKITQTKKLFSSSNNRNNSKEITNRSKKYSTQIKIHLIKFLNGNIMINFAKKIQSTKDLKNKLLMKINIINIWNKYSK